MENHPIACKVLCAGFVAAFILPLGEYAYPHVESVLNGFTFDALEALLSASLGYIIHAAVFGS